MDELLPEASAHNPLPVGYFTRRALEARIVKKATQAVRRTLAGATPCGQRVPDRALEA